MNNTYTVKPGDTLYGISNQFGVSVTALAELNNIKGSNLQIGTVLKIPNTSGTNPNNMFMYTVKKGDSLYSIAKKYNTTVDEIKNLNYLKTNNLAIGQILRIPETYNNQNELVIPNYTNYKVVKGDSLYKIAKLYNVSVDTIIKDNNLNSDNLTIGQNLKIRIPSSYEEVEECFGEEYIPPTSSTLTTNYKVLKGESLYSIAKKFNTNIDTLKKLNNLSNNSLSIGQIIKVPTNNIEYIVKKGDSLYSIAKKYNTTIDSIKKKNNLTSNNLSIGKKLII